MCIHVNYICKINVNTNQKLLGLFCVKYTMLRATNNCGLNFYGEKMILGIQKTGSIHQSQMADVLKPPSAGRIS